MFFILVRRRNLLYSIIDARGKKSKGFVLAQKDF
jgi:hypothetical protein